MHPHGLRQPVIPIWIVCMAAGVLSAILSAAPALASPRAWQPLILKGAQLPSLLGQPTNRFEVMAVQGGKLAPIPFQIDEVAADGTWALPDGPSPTRDESPGVLDNEDEIVMMISDLGGRIIDPKSLPAGAHEIAMADPLGGPDRYAYVAAVDHPDISTRRYISYDPATDFIETDNYRIGFVKGLPHYFAMQQHLGEHPPSMIDRFKVRVRARVLEVFRFSLNEDDVRNRLLAWKVGPVRIIRRLSHSVDLMLGIRSPEVDSEDFFYPDYVENPFQVHFPWVPRVIFGDLHVRIDIDFTNLAGYELMWSGMRSAPVAIGNQNAERALENIRPRPQITWIAFRGGGRTTVQTIAPTSDLNLLQRRLYFHDDPTIPDPPESTRGEHPGIGYVMTGWEALSRGTHSLDSMLVSAPGDYDPNVLLRELDTPPLAKIDPRGASR